MAQQVLPPLVASETLNSRAPLSSTRARRAGLAGITAALLLFGNEVFLADTPVPSDTAGTVARFFTHHAAQALATAVIQVFVAAAFVTFILGLSRIVRHPESRHATLVRLGVRAGCAGAGLIALRYLVEGALASGIATHASAHDVWWVYEAGLRVAVVGYLFLGISLVAAASTLRRTLVLSRWLGWLGLVGGAALIVSIGSLTNLDGPLDIFAFVGLILMVLWLLLTGVTLTRRAERITGVSRSHEPAG